MEYIKCVDREWGAEITVHRPEALNALNMDVLNELDETLSRMEKERSARVLVLTGAGEKAFAAGADIAAMRDMTPQEAMAFSTRGQAVMEHLERMPAVVLAAVSGYALGGGCELALACDIRIASPTAVLGVPEVSLGVIPGFGGTQRLPRIVGMSRALELMATGRRVDAWEALRIGLVNRVVEDETPLEACRAMAAKIAENSAWAVALGKQSIRQGVEMEIGQAMKLEAALFAAAFSGPDQREGMDAFLQKRRAKFNA